MTGRERLMTAIRLGQTDCVPVCPDISNMVPCRLTGRPFWDIYLHEKPTLYEAYRDAVDYFGFDGWWTDYFSTIQPITREPFRWEHFPVREEDGRKIRRSLFRTPEGDLERETTYYPADSPTETEKPLKDLKASRHLWKYLFPEVSGIRADDFLALRKDWGDRGILGIWIPAPGFNVWLDWLQDGVMQCSVLYYEEKEVLDEFNEVYTRHFMRLLDLILPLQPDFILTGGSGGFALQSPTIWREYALPALREITRRAKEAGVLTMVHSCGRQAQMVKWCAEETDLNCINPLEPPPMGDCSLADLKREFGSKICLMGNLHTTDVMLRGSVREVEKAATEAIDAAGGGGGFILSTGDQCGRDTPYENIFRLIDVARSYGQYR